MRLWGILAILSLLGLLHLDIDTTTASFLDREDPAWVDYQRAIQRHGGDEFIVVALEGDAPWDRDLVAALGPLSDKVAQLPGVRRVDSLATVPLMRADGEGLRLDSGLADGVPESEAEPSAAAG